ncbi:ATP-binding protein [Marimonas sp. MJW-29]|uniref:histidine kinase n=1 Tax=Sulfitobacter sediminis TaxID=3234186 RepID=A0ABV3RI43_9RHOB
MGWLGDNLFPDGGLSPQDDAIASTLPVLYSHIAADLLIALSCFAISAAILLFLRHRPDGRLHWTVMLVVIFITASGVTHLIGLLAMFLPLFGFEGLIKLITGIVSALAALALWRQLPNALRTPAQQELMQAISDRDAEISQHRVSEEAMQATERLLNIKIEQLEAANLELREFAYAASHDLKSPANTLSLWLENFMEDCAERLSPEERKDAEEAQRILARMRMLVDDVLSCARLLSDEAAAPQACDTARIVADTLADLAPEIEAAEAEIVAGPLVTVRGHPAMLSVLFHNLIGNAIKFRHKNRPCRVEISARLDGSRATILVRDNGIGIDPVHHERVFSLFKRLHHHTLFEGTGLGLSLCRRIAVMHGGRIELNSVPGSGTEMRVVFDQEALHVAQAA